MQSTSTAPSTRKDMTHRLRQDTGACAENSVSHVTTHRCEHQPEKVTENENAKLPWDYSIQSDISPQTRLDSDQYN